MEPLSGSEMREDRYSRLRLIPWWDQDAHRRLPRAGDWRRSAGQRDSEESGAAGFSSRGDRGPGPDRGLEPVAHSVVSLRRCGRTEGRGGRARLLSNWLKARWSQPIAANVVQDCGLGVFEWADLILAGLDNREARLWINRAAWKVGRPWIDGAIEGINGVARVFLPGQAPCYECTLGESGLGYPRDSACRAICWRIGPNAAGKVPTTPTISSIIAGIQVQEAVKLLHGLPTLASRGFVFEGLNHTSYTVEYTENPDCMSHYTIPELVRLPEPSSAWTVDSCGGVRSRIWAAAE